MTQHNEGEAPFENPFISREEFEKAVKSTPEWERLTQLAISFAYDSIQAQPVFNLPDGSHLVTAIVAVRGGEKGLETHKFSFAFLTENGHVAAQS